MICLDTTLIVDFLRSNPNAIRAVKEREDSVLITTTVSTFELFFGVLRKNQASDKELNDLKKFIDRILVIGMSYESSVKASEIASDLVKKGLEIESHDCLIAGIMLTNNCNTIITRDKEHFKRIKGIKVESY